MGFIGLLILAAIPHVTNPWAESALIFVGGALVLYQIKDNQQSIVHMLTTMGGNQQKIYGKLSK